MSNRGTLRAFHWCFCTPLRTPGGPSSIAPTIYPAAAGGCHRGWLERRLHRPALCHRSPRPHPGPRALGIAPHLAGQARGAGDVGIDHIEADGSNRPGLRARNCGEHAGPAGAARLPGSYGAREPQGPGARVEATMEGLLEDDSFRELQMIKVPT